MNTSRKTGSKKTRSEDASARAAGATRGASKTPAGKAAAKPAGKAAGPRKERAAAAAGPARPAKTVSAPPLKARAASRLVPSSLLAPVFDAVRRRTGKSAHKDAEAFAQAFYRRMTSDELPLHSADGWAALAADLFAFAEKRKPGTANVRLFNPGLKTHGWESPHTVLQIVNDDMPFLVDSVTMALAEQGIGVHVLGHPVLQIARDGCGRLTGVGEGEAESVMHLEIDRQTPEDNARIETLVRKVLGDVRVIVADWSVMREKMQQAAADLVSRPMPVSDAVRREAQEFLRWAANDHFTFFGYREYKVRKKGGDGVLEAVDGSGLGLLRAPGAVKSRPLETLAAHNLRAVGQVDALILTKTSTRCTVHRPGYMDYIGVMRYDAQGNALSEQRFLGLYTSSAYTRRPWEIPLVRDRFEHVMSESGLKPTGHSGKALKHILETLPRDELFQSTPDELLRLATGVLGLQERVRSRMFLRRDRYGRFYSVLVYIPRDRFSTDVRRRIEQLLRRVMHADQVDASVLLGESPLAQLNLIVRPRPGERFEVDEAALEAELSSIMRNWQDDLRDELVRRHGEAEGLALAHRIGRLLPADYIEQASPAVAATDVEKLAAVEHDDVLALSLCTLPSVAPGERALRFKLYRRHADIALSDVLPVMENLGLRVVTEHPHRIVIDETPLHIQDFEVEPLAGTIDVDAQAAAFTEAFDRVWRGDAENDGFNRLVLGADLEWRQVAMLRGYCKYLLQVGVPFSQAYVEDTLNRYPLLARMLVEVFEARFDPDTGRESKAEIAAGVARLERQLRALAGGDEATMVLLAPVLEARRQGRNAQYDASRRTLKALLDRVSSLDEDRILRSYLGVIDATLRTSYYQHGADGATRETIAFKFDSARVPELPKPRPYREIFVYGPRVEGIHLRFGPVARGGLRWSDRREDFRTEVLGLVKAQMVKNTVIVPVGSKGGFIVKRPPVGGNSPAEIRDAQFAEGVACYKLFINGLLDITDNIVDGAIVPPQRVVRHDDNDPYLVVAADKGTATFSDTANGIAREHGFWLDDAFASGGSVGYDHKGMGITARGAWESVKRHFRALGHDSQAQDFTCVGIGDMSGDVFGNGMLLSRHIRLVAAFDHRHIFIDPSPDAARSFAERERLFALPRSSWEDYDRTLIGKGGGVWPRSAKSIPLSPQARQALGIEGTAGEISPIALMSAILRAPVDLLWNGGIGTYVKSSGEQNSDVGDRANNALRVDGRDLRCRVVGEGGNLGLTQLGRIEAALNGVMLNTDFIDNSAGVDTSDHEVNIKILLNGLVREGRMTLPARNRLLASMTDEVAALVLWDNYRQNQALSLMERMSLSRLGSKQHFIRTLEAQGLLDRQIEYLPSDAEIGERKLKGQGLTRPELAVLLSYSKLVAFDQMLDSDIPEDPYLSRELQRYFPAPLQKKYAADMEHHRLKREIIATAVTNTMINRMGATFLLRMQEDSGRSPGEVAKAFTISRETIEARALWGQIDALDGKVSESVQVDALQVIWTLQRAFTRWLLARPGAIPDITTAVERYHDGFHAIRNGRQIIADSQRPQLEASLQAWRDKGVPEGLGEQLAALPYLEPCCDIIELAAERGEKVIDVARLHFRLGEALNLPWLTEQIDALEVDGRWHAVARGVLREELGQQQRALVAQVLAMQGATPEEKVAAWLQRDDQTLRFTLTMLSELAAQKALDYPTASVAVQRVSQLVQRG
ncbi:NAD-glutamate dehydrogenase [Luteimonas sp. BDR2-5]|uniref:NAD-glutamate dehydrogenase n=1 Tax=Proluteimonas luteida TaxID=2878685 RepID=UPI001E39A3DA|nr:NAD-glutamate dehydrogenase domain-containing protein [Luteimonas sp. BDR2-5]MCD9028649.1 NAD-glutamate dehydrogenase [Luteimonas sp. BDR2-5]